jgi:hypothetical protein
MSGGRADYVPIRPWDLAANTLLTSLTHGRALLIMVAVPELVRIAIYFANDAVDQRIGQSQVLPNWLIGLATLAISGIVFTNIIRYVALGETSRWLPARSLLRPYLLTAAILIALWTVTAFITDDVFSKLYPAYYPDEPLDEQKLIWWERVQYWNSFALSALLIAAFYPDLGVTAVEGEFGIYRLLRWWRKYFLRFLLLSAVLMSVCLVVRRAYWWLLDTLVPGLTAEISYIGREALRIFVVQMTEVPMDLLFDIVPAVAIGLLFRVLRANSADL